MKFRIVASILLLSIFFSIDIAAQDVAAIELRSYPLQKDDNSQWDALADGPDIFIKLVAESGRIVFETRTAHDIVQADLPLIWDLPETIRLRVDETYTWFVIDSDLMFDDEMDQTDYHEGSYYDGYDLIVLPTTRNHYLLVHLNK